MLELTAEPLNYDKITKFRNLQGPMVYGRDNRFATRPPKSQYPYP
jgi:hypothetical protein